MFLMLQSLLQQKPVKKSTFLVKKHFKGLFAVSNVFIFYLAHLIKRLGRTAQRCIAHHHLPPQ